MLPAGIDNQTLSASGTVEIEVRQIDLQLCPCVPRHLLCK